MNISKKILLLLTLTSMFALTSCAICTCQYDLPQTINDLAMNSSRAEPLKASGSCILNYHDEKGKSRKESFPIKIRTYPPDMIYFWCDPFAMPKAFTGGANNREFWISIKPDPYDTYVWGTLDQANLKCLQNFWLTPQMLLELLGSWDIADFQTKPWTLNNQTGTAVLQLKDSAGNTAKKIYLNCCDYRPSAIEYFSKGEIFARTQLSNYRQVNSAYAVPGTIVINFFEDGKISDTLSIKLSSADIFNLASDKIDQVFKRPQPRGFKNIYKLSDNCDLIEQDF